MYVPVCMCPPLNLRKNRPIVAKRIRAFGDHPSARALALTGNNAALRGTAGRQELLARSCTGQQTVCRTVGEACLDITDMDSEPTVP
jgi:hypothetical protein